MSLLNSQKKDKKGTRYVASFTEAMVNLTNGGVGVNITAPLDSEIKNTYVSYCNSSSN
jgi:hypothetical protein